MSRAAAPACDVLGLGENSVDIVYLLPAYPQPHGPLAKLQIRGQEICVGGQMVTALSTCAALGLRTRYIGVTGADEHGERVRRALAEHGVDTADAIVREAPTRYAVILLDESAGERVILWARDQRLDLRPDELPLEAIAGARVLHVDGVDEDAAIRAALAGRAAGIHVTSDLDRLTPRTGELFQAVTIPILAEHLPAAMTGHEDLETALRALRQRHDGLLVVTLGADGAAALIGDRLLRVAGFAVDVVDTTGAGDVFRGAFIHGLLQDWPLDDTLRFANAAAAVSCTRRGALNGVPAPAEIQALLDRQPRPHG